MSDSSLALFSLVCNSEPPDAECPSLPASFHRGGHARVRGDWKLIRLFHQGDAGAHRWRLYNLREDLGERNDLSAERPEPVAELDALIAAHLADAATVTPQPNPAFDPSAYRPDKEGQPARRDPSPGRKRLRPGRPRQDEAAPKEATWPGRKIR